MTSNGEEEQDLRPRLLVSVALSSSPYKTLAALENGSEPNGELGWGNADLLDLL
jgi:hypothetical protein